MKKSKKTTAFRRFKASKLRLDLIETKKDVYQITLTVYGKNINRLPADAKDGFKFLEGLSSINPAINLKTAFCKNYIRATISNVDDKTASMIITGIAQGVSQDAEKFYNEQMGLIKEAVAALSSLEKERIADADGSYLPIIKG